MNILIEINLMVTSNYEVFTEIHLKPDYKVSALSSTTGNAQVWLLLALIMSMMRSTMLWLSLGATKVCCCFPGICYIPLMFFIKALLEVLFRDGTVVIGEWCGESSLYPLPSTSQTNRYFLRWLFLLKKHASITFFQVR